MPAKKKTSKPPPKGPTPYVRKRVRELAAEHGWDVEHVEKLVVGEDSPPAEKKGKS